MIRQTDVSVNPGGLGVLSLSLSSIVGGLDHRYIAWHSSFITLSSYFRVTKWVTWPPGKSEIDLLGTKVGVSPEPPANLPTHTSFQSSPPPSYK